MMKLKIVALLLSMFLTVVFSEPMFLTSPGVVAAYPGEIATMTWTVNETISSSWYILYDYMNASGIRPVYSRSGTPFGLPGSEYSGRISANIQVGTISFTLSGITASDVTYNYRCSVSTALFSTSVNNTHGWFIMYGKINTPVLTSSPSDPVENTAVTLTCTTSSTSTIPYNLPTNLLPNMTYSWQRDNTDLPDDGRHRVSGKGGGTLTINTVQRQDNGKTYTCTARETGSRESSMETINMNVRYKPGLAIAGQDTIGPYFERHASVITMSCTVTDPGNPAAQFEWRKEGVVQVTNTGSYSIPGGTLSVSQHDGLWRCTPVNTVGRAQPDNITVTVYAAPVFVTTPTNQTVTAETLSSLNVLCSISGKPAPQVTWLYEGGALPPGTEVISESDVIKDKLVTVSRRLRWSGSSTLEQRRLTSGVYTCRGNVTTKVIEHSIGVAAHYGPYNTAITPSGGNITSVENDSLTLSCAATCNPGCSYTWSKDGGNDNTGGQLSLTSIRRQDQGSYRCTASNGVGVSQHRDVFVTVNYPPQLSVTVTPTPSGVDKPQQGDNVTMLCAVDSRPHSAILWMNTTDPSHTTLTAAGSNITHSWIMLPHVDILDSGSFVCSADNKIRGSPVTRETDLTIYGPARWYKVDPPDMIRGVGVGETTSFNVWVIAQPLPTQSYWVCEFTPVNISGAGKSDSCQLIVTGDHASLTVNGVAEKHFGNYSIWTRNKHGGWNKGDLVFNLIAQGVPQQPINLTVTDVTAVSITVKWLTGFNGGLDQTFTIKYTDTATGEERQITDIADTGTRSGHVITQHITDGIQPETEYLVELFAVNNQGSTPGGQETVTTPASSQSLIIGAVVGSVAAVAIIAIILIVLWRKGIIPGKRRDPDDDQSIRRPGSSTPENGQSNPAFDVIDPVEPEYSQVELNRGVVLVPAAGSSQPPVYAQVDKNRKKPKPTPGADPAALYSQVDKKGKKSKAKPVPDDPAALYSQVNKPKKKAANNAQAGPSQPGPSQAGPSQDPDPAAMYSQVNKPGKKGKPPAPPAACLSQPAATDSPSLRGADPAALYSQVDKTRKQTASDTQPAPSVDEPESAVYSQVNKPGKKPEQSASPRASMYPPVATARQPKPAQPQVPQNAKNKPPKKGLLKLFKGKEPKPDASISGATYENVEMGTRAGLSTRVVGEGAYVNVPDAGEQDGVYSEVRIQPVGPEDTGRNGFQRIGADGTTYAELDFIKKNAVDNGDAKVHGAENRTEYASIDIAKLLPKQDKTKKK